MAKVFEVAVDIMDILMLKLKAKKKRLKLLLACRSRMQSY